MINSLAISTVPTLGLSGEGDLIQGHPTLQNSPQVTVNAGVLNLGHTCGAWGEYISLACGETETLVQGRRSWEMWQPLWKTIWQFLER